MRAKIQCDRPTAWSFTVVALLASTIVTFAQLGVAHTPLTLLDATHSTYLRNNIWDEFTQWQTNKTLIGGYSE